MSYMEVWIVMRDDAITELKADVQAYRADSYTGDYPKMIQFFSESVAQGVMERVSRMESAAGRDFRLFSFYTNKRQDIAEIRADIEAYDAAEPANKFGIAGAWHSDGRQLGADYTEEGVIASAPLYPIDDVQLLKFMPDVSDGGDPPVFSPATELTDIHLMAGQTPRDFQVFTP